MGCGLFLLVAQLEIVVEYYHHPNAGGEQGQRCIFSDEDPSDSGLSPEAYFELLPIRHGVSLPFGSSSEKLRRCEWFFSFFFFEIK